MVRTKTPAKSAKDLYSSKSTSLNVSTKSGAESPSSSSNDRSRQQNLSNDSHNKSQLSRKSIPRKNTSENRTELFVKRSTAVVEKSGRKRKMKVKVLRDIKFLQSSVHNLIPKANFSRLVRSILQNCESEVYRFTSSSLEALQESAEIYLTCLFADCNLLAHHAKRVTIKPMDMVLAMNLRGNR